MSKRVPPVPGLHASDHANLTIPVSLRVRHRHRHHPWPAHLLTSRCPTFLLAPGSSLAAPELVRQQLKTVYLVNLLQRSQPSVRSATRWPKVRHG